LGEIGIGGYVPWFIGSHGDCISYVQRLGTGFARGIGDAEKLLAQVAHFGRYVIERLRVSISVSLPCVSLTSRGCAKSGETWIKKR